MNLFFFSSPATFYRLAGAVAPWFFVLAALLAAAGLYVGFLVAPVDAVQGEVYRVIFLHVPAAWMSMFLYFVMACWGAISLVFNTRLSAFMARAIAPTGALFTFIALWSVVVYAPIAHWVWHQGSSVSFKGTTMHIAMLQGMLLMAFACWMYAIGAALVRVRSIILEREARTRWVRQLGSRAIDAFASPGLTK